MGFADDGPLKSPLAAGSNVHAHDKNGHRTISILLHRILSDGIRFGRMRSLQALVFHGAKWDENCARWLANIANNSSSQTKEGSSDGLISHDVARAMRLCSQRWIEKYENRLPPSNIPEEDIKRGYQATKTYLDQLAKSTHVVLRRKICVVGPSNWGKTSLVKSLVVEEPSLVHPDDRTIGIDKFKLSFDQLRSVAGSAIHHEVTFWDFAGQDEYQVAHSLFFSRRTLYLVCIDLSAYATTYYKAEMITSGDPMALSERMNAFVETRILRWIRLILARQPDAEFQFVATKDDLMQVMDADALADLKSRLANVLMIVGSIITGDEGSSIIHLGDRRLEGMTGKPVAEMTVVSCAEPESVDAALSKIKSLICQSERSYAMPDSYSKVLCIIKQKRKAAQTGPMSSRIAQWFVKVDDLTSELAQPVKGIDKCASRDILRALRDIGDVLWYEDVDDATLREAVVLDPLLLIDLIRKIFNHKQKSEVLYRADLKQLEMFPGLRASSSTRLGGAGGPRPKLATCTRPVAKWLPPEPTLSECRELLTSARKALVVESSEVEINRRGLATAAVAEPEVAVSASVEAAGTRVESAVPEDKMNWTDPLRRVRAKFGMWRHQRRERRRQQDHGEDREETEQQRL